MWVPDHVAERCEKMPADALGRSSFREEKACLDCQLTTNRLEMGWARAGRFIHHIQSQHRLQVLPLLMVDNSNFSPSRLTFPLVALYASFSEGDDPFSSVQTKRNLHEPTDVLVLPPVLSHAVVCRVLAPS
jgi:hypothetical protein